MRGSTKLQIGPEIEAAGNGRQDESKRGAFSLGRKLSRARLKALLAAAISTVSSTLALSGFDEGAASYRIGNYNGAFKEWAEAARQGNADAQYNLGCMFVRGEGVPPNATMGREWLQRAADQGDFDATTWLFMANLLTDAGRKKFTSMKLKPNDKFRLTFVTKLSDGKMHRRPCSTDATDGAQIEFGLGLQYETGSNGFSKDDRQAADWYRRASERNYPEAQTRLAYLYAAGRGVEQSQIEAERLFRKAAERGEGIAQANLAAMYASGSFGHAKDLVLAYVLTSHATGMGKKLAIRNLPEIRALLSADQLLEGEQLAEKWKPNVPWPAEVAARLGPSN